MIKRNELKAVVEKERKKRDEEQAGLNNQVTFFDSLEVALDNAVLEASKEEHFFNELDTALDKQLIDTLLQGHHALKIDQNSLDNAATKQANKIISKYDLVFESIDGYMLSKSYTSTDMVKKLVKNKGIPVNFDFDNDDDSEYLDQWIRTSLAPSQLKRKIKSRIEDIDLQQVIPVLKDAGYPIRKGIDCYIVWLWKDNTLNKHILYSKDGSKKAVAPAYYIEKYIKDNDISRAEFAKKCHLPLATLNDFLKGNHALSSYMCACFAKGTGTNRMMWENISAKFLIDSTEIN